MEISTHRRKIRLTASQAHPRLELQGRRLHCNGIPFSLERKPLASRIVSAFMLHPQHTIPRDELLDLMISRTRRTGEQKSHQHVLTRGQSLNRLMSRLRHEFGKKFHGVVPDGTYWFHYASEKKTWLLYKLPGEGVDGQFYE